MGFFFERLKNSLEQTGKQVRQKTDDLRKNIHLEKDQMKIHDFCDSFFYEKINISD